MSSIFQFKAAAPLYFLQILCTTPPPGKNGMCPDGAKCQCVCERETEIEPNSSVLLRVTKLSVTSVQSLLSFPRGKTASTIFHGVVL